MVYLGRVPHVRRPASGGADHGILYAFSDVLIIAWIKPSFLGAFGLRREPMPRGLRELDALPPSDVSVDDLLQRCTRQSSCWSTEEIASAVLDRSKFFGVLGGASVIELTSRDGEKSSFYADRDAWGPVADFLSATLGDRFENRRQA